MWTKETIEQFMQEFGFKPSMTKAEIKELPNVLTPDEKLHGLLEGMLTKVHNRDINGMDLLLPRTNGSFSFEKVSWAL